MKQKTAVWSLFSIMVLCQAGTLFDMVNQKVQAQENHRQYEPKYPKPFTDAEMQVLYTAYNIGYFNGKLPPVTFAWHTKDPDAIMQTHCVSQRTSCVIFIEPVLSPTQVYTQMSLLHEMCHIETWGEGMLSDGTFPNQEAAHGKRWRACMLRTEMDGAWRRTLIDGYEGN